MAPEGSVRHARGPPMASAEDVRHARGPPMAEIDNLLKTLLDQEVTSEL